MRTFLYLEDDVIDQMHMQRFFSKIEGISLTVLSDLDSLKRDQLFEYDMIISDANLQDAEKEDIKLIIQHHPSHYWLSGTVKDDEFQKPIQKETILTLVGQIKNRKYCFDYLREMAEGDSEYFNDMLKLGISLLPERLNELNNAKDDPKILAKNAHKAKSTFRILGIEDTLLVNLESNQGLTEKEISSLLAQVNQLINEILPQLKKWSDLALSQ